MSRCPLLVLRSIQAGLGSQKRALLRRVLPLAILIVLTTIQCASAQEADLVVLDLTFSPETIDAGAHPSSVTYAYGNAGPDDIDADSVETELFLSRNTTLGDADDIRIWQSERFFGLFSAGDGFNFTLGASSLAQITIPADASGNYYVFVRVDHAASSSYFDPDISDNKLRRVGTITVNPPMGPRLVGASSAPDFQLTLSGIAGRSYRFEWAATLGSWNTLATVVADSSGNAQYVDTGAASLERRFYRAVVLP